MSEYHGHMTLADGSHVALTADDAEKIWRESEQRTADRAAKLPDEKIAIGAMFEAFDRLRELGWREAIYCPKDGSKFQVIEPGSTGVFTGWYDGPWPDGKWWSSDGTDIYPSRPVLFRLFPEDQAAHDAKMAALREAFRASSPSSPSRKVET